MSWNQREINQAATYQKTVDTLFLFKSKLGFFLIWFYLLHNWTTMNRNEQKRTVIIPN